MKSTADGKAEHEFTRQVIPVVDRLHVLAHFFRPKFVRTP